MAYSRKISSLEESASAQVAVNLCQEIAFKEVVLCLEKPTYCNVMDETDEQWKGKYFLTSLEESIPMPEIRQWEYAVNEQCQRLTEGLPCRLKYRVLAWMYRIALECLSCCWRQESCFGVSRYFLMDALTLKCWTKAGQLDEKKLAEQLLKDERLTVLKRYRMACKYGLRVHVHELWNRLTQKEKLLIPITNHIVLQLRWEYRKIEREGDDFQIVELWNSLTYEEKKSFVCNDPNSPYWSAPFIKLWSNKKDEHEEYWPEAAISIAVSCGNRAAVMSCWKKLKIHRQKKLVIEMAWRSVQEWQKMKDRLEEYADWNENPLLTRHSPSIFIKYFTLPSYYIDLMCFFLLQMDEEQQLSFFKQACQSSYHIALECYLDWPHQDDFLPTISRLWGIMPMDMFRKCLLTLASKYVGDYRIEGFSSLGKGICNYDYRSLLQTLWEETPEEYKRSVFDTDYEKYGYPVGNVGKMLLLRLLERFPFQRKDEDLFKQIFCYQPLEQRKAMMLSEMGETICDLLTQKEKWSFLNLLLDECFSKEEIPSFKTQFIQSNCCRKMCLIKVQQNFENWVEDLMDWSLDSDTEKTQYKRALITEEDGFLITLYSSFWNGDVDHVKRIINFCEPLEEKREPTMVRYIKDAFSGLLEACKWEQLDAILVESFDSDGIRRFKKDLFSKRGIALHYHCVFLLRELEEVERFYKWFDLSPDEIKKVKQDTLYMPDVFSNICSKLDGLISKYATPLSWCLVDEEMTVEFKRKIEDRLNTLPVSDEVRERVKVNLDRLVSEHLCTFRKDVIQNNTSDEAVLVKNKGEKKSSVSIEEGCSFPRKRFRSNIDIENPT
ncbi:uncharacterized protein NPIL_551781 [Nephila pilipes]|uniref:Uncharacterized protein n=1 Tax=Nephila pilipes TaxID=299642 RepID=A0A8X6TL40_NEPPI|nr:uncharacterized protein NPIL_551781 [Nephila pilipes]